MKNRDIIVVGLQPWDIEIGSNCKNIAMELSGSNRILYVNRALDRISSIRNKNDKKVQQRLRSIKGEISDLEEVQKNLWVLNPRVILESVNKLPAFLFNYFNRLNNRRLASAISDAAARLGFENPILFIDNDFFRAYHLPEMLDVSASIYYIRDYLVEQPYFEKHGPAMEQGLMKKVTMVAANSAYLAKYASKYNPHSVDIGQGCDFSLFQKTSYPLPADLASIPSPRIGYVGALISSRLDIALLESVAEKCPDWSIVLVGPEDEAFRNSRLHHMSNVYFPGSKKPEQLPDYIAGFDVCINPQLVNKLTTGNYPRKIDEYLALGKPVVATFTEFMRSFQDYVYLSRDADEFIDVVKLALAEDPAADWKEKRMEFALSHTWENSVKRLSQAFEQLEPVNA